MNKNDLKMRTKRFATDTIRFVNSLPKSKANDLTSCQLLMSATSVAANYRSRPRGRSSAEFLSKLNVVRKETDESMLWLELFSEMSSGHSQTELLSPLKESNKLSVIFVASVNTAKKNQRTILKT